MSDDVDAERARAIVAWPDLDVDAFDMLGVDVGVDVDGVVDLDGDGDVEVDTTLDDLRLWSSDKLEAAVCARSPCTSRGVDAVAHVHVAAAVKVHDHDQVHDDESAR